MIARASSIAAIGWHAKPLALFPCVLSAYIVVGRSSAIPIFLAPALSPGRAVGHHGWTVCPAVEATLFQFVIADPTTNYVCRLAFFAALFFGVPAKTGCLGSSTVPIVIPASTAVENVASCTRSAMANGGGVVAEAVLRFICGGVCGPANCDSGKIQQRTKH
jgi:hypothetical protein